MDLIVLTAPDLNQHFCLLQGRGLLNDAVADPLWEREPLLAAATGRIIAGRPCRRVTELIELKGIGPKRL